MTGVDTELAYDAYLDRFRDTFGERPAGAFVKFGRHMVQKLARRDFDERLHRYLEMHDSTREMLTSGATINDALVLEFEESAAWIALETPDMLTIFKGEIGDPSVATGQTRP